MAMSSERTGRWARLLGTRAKNEQAPELIPFTEEGPDALANVESLLESAVGGDPSLAGTLKGLGGGLLTVLSEPIAVITDEYQAGRVKELRAAFLRENADTLIALDESLRAAKARMRELSALLGNATVGSNWPEPDRILAEKMTVGDRVLRDINRALQETNDPQERARLEALRDEMTEWMAERDARIEAERPEVDELRERLSQLWDQLLNLRPIIREAATATGPKTEVGCPHPDAEMAVLTTTHHRPDAVAHVVSLRDLLLAARAGLTRAMSPEE
ncbi:MAG TPA: hypothetical protein VNO14_04980 [Blastocatellia bacterium]|nr:hypothetical protein [Blastocatellia bacterium]